MNKLSTEKFLQAVEICKSLQTLITPLTPLSRSGRGVGGEGKLLDYRNASPLAALISTDNPV
ncbi:MAG TPA: hypothetical protein IGS52_18735 [Oscillatoriaceae cyanobacterium M33_DOE_052]|uniref:Uncharacterized protein n=1 Tax=Planktothricoides sp. SpSt-374 TaxID=2282167 RepID=A0A7C3VJ78_9CYAN|nr:hypothetical protein [Oscillatoriaceae cyanobacterium M33_DOE_052]